MTGGVTDSVNKAMDTAAGHAQKAANDWQALSDGKRVLNGA